VGAYSSVLCWPHTEASECCSVFQRWLQHRLLSHHVSHSWVVYWSHKTPYLLHKIFFIAVCCTTVPDSTPTTHFVGSTIRNRGRTKYDISSSYRNIDSCILVWILFVFFTFCPVLSCFKTQRAPVPISTWWWASELCSRDQRPKETVEEYYHNMLWKALDVNAKADDSSAL